MALELVPLFQFAEVLKLQRETREARRLFELKSGFSIEGARDVRSLVRQAGLGGALEPSMLLDIQATLASGRSVKGTFNKLGYQFLSLSDIVKPISELRPLDEEINRSISPRGEILDSASPILGRIRAEIRVSHDRLVSRLNEILSSPLGRLVTQEPIITIRDGRYVLPVKAEMKGQLRGIVHDTSASGMTLFMEPLGTVELNNQWREAQIEERREVDRILKRLTGRVARFGQAIITNVECLAELDLALAKARLAVSMQATEPVVLAIHGSTRSDSTMNMAETTTPPPARDSTPDRRDKRSESGECVWAAPPWPREPYVSTPNSELSSPGQTLTRPLIQLINARHPLLTGAVVPTTVEVGAEFSILVITGPNTGGKTVALKTAGLLTLMALAGLQIPADEGSKVSVVDGIYADIGDEQSIEQSLSTFSSHMGNIIEILKVAGPRSLVLLDELGAGTDPTEGSALARAILSNLLHKRICAIATTHFNEIKAFAYTTPDVANASVEFDVETLTPTYKLSIGLPGRSNALAIAARLGLPDEIINQARDILSPAQLQVESLLGAIQAEREEAEISRRALDQRLAATTRMEAELLQKRAAIESERTEAIDSARHEALAEVHDLLEQIRQLGRTARSSHAEITQLAALRDRAVAAEREVVKRLKRTSPKPLATTDSLGPIKQGDTVFVRHLKQLAEVISEPDAKGEIEVQLGSFKARVTRENLEKRSKRSARSDSPSSLQATFTAATAKTPPLQLDLRGRRAEEIIPEVEQYLNDAYLGGLPFVRLIHGKGTGALRQIVRERLTGHPLIRSFSAAEDRDGGEGVTIAVLAQ